MSQVIDLKVIREKYGLTEDELAALLEVNAETLNSYEKDPSSITIDKILLLAKGLNLPLDDLIQGHVTDGQFNLIFTYSNIKLKNERENLVESIDKAELALSDFKVYANDYREFSEIYEQFTNIYKNAKHLNKKPNVTFLGKSDSGKSTMINTILGNELTPTYYQPVTSSIIKIMHIDDKPKYMKKEENTLIFKTSIDEGPVTDEQIYDLDLISEKLVDRGDYSIIKKHGVSENSRDDKADYIISIYAFSDAKILELINLLDTPGTSTGGHKQGQKDTAASEYARSMADMYVYLSVSNQFLQLEDHIYLRDILEIQNYSMDNIFVVASQAQIIPNKDEFIKNGGILDAAAERFYKSIQASSHNQNAPLKLQDFRKHIFTFSKDNPTLSIKFKHAFIEQIERHVEDNIAATKQYLIGANKEMEVKISKSTKNLTELKNNESARSKEYKKLLEQEKQITSEIDLILKEANSKVFEYEVMAKTEFKRSYEEILDEKYIVEVIDEFNFKNEKNTGEILELVIRTKLKEKHKKILGKYSKKYNDFLYENIEDIEINESTFNVQENFANSLIDGSVGGALYNYIEMLYAKSQFSFSTNFANLAILPDKNPLPSLSLFNLILISYKVYKMLAWKRTIAQSIKKAYKKQNVLEMFLDNIEQYWDDTIQSTETALNKTKEQFYVRLGELGNTSGKSTAYFDFNIYLIT